MEETDLLGPGANRIRMHVRWPDMFNVFESRFQPRLLTRSGHMSQLYAERLRKGVCTDFVPR
jgi:hypothetical protein